MITITPEAAAQIRQSVEVSSSQGMHLRIAVRREEDGTFVYGMGFDEERENDLVLDCEGVTILISPRSQELLAGTTLDFVEVNSGEFQFIFVSPDDPGACGGRNQPSGCSSCGSKGNCS